MLNITILLYIAAIKRQKKHGVFIMVDENEFFRQASLRICGSLDIAKAMTDLLNYIKAYIPVSELSLSRFDPSFTFFENLVTISAAGKVRIIPPISTPPQLIPLLQTRLMEWLQQGTIAQIVDDMALDPISSVALPYYETSDPSVMVMLLIVESVIVGSIGIFAKGPGVFTPDHARLFSLLREPFAIAMSNALRYEEVLRLKDMVDAENRELNRELLIGTAEEIIGAESGLAGVMEMVRQVAPLASPVMLLGETGVGKEVIANAIHRFSPRREDSFIKVNCGAIPESLIDAELFGHEKGAFTGAAAQKRGRFERAHKGTIFLDEVAELPPQAQVRLLRVLQNKEIERVGGTQTISVDVRVISATNKNLEAMVRSGTFREDLWYRLNIFPITIPPLRQRSEDIPGLVHYFVEKKARELKIHTLPAISSTGSERLKSHVWPGNVRELENLIERELIRGRGMEESARPLFEHFNRAEEGAVPRQLLDADYENLSLDEAMAHHIRQTLRRSGGKIYGPDGAAGLLKINPNTLRSRMKKLGVSAKHQH